MLAPRSPVERDASTDKVGEARMEKCGGAAALGREQTISWERAGSAACRSVAIVRQSDRQRFRSITDRRRSQWKWSLPVRKLSQL